MIVSNVLFWYLQIVNLLPFFLILIYQDKSFYKWYKSCYCVISGSSVKYLAPQNTFLEDVRFLKLEISLPKTNHGVCKEKSVFQKVVYPKKSG